MAKLNETLLDEKLEALEKARSWSPRVVSKFEGLLRTEEDFDLFRINPHYFAKEKNVTEKEAIDLMLHATKAGILNMNWQLVCPSCGDSVESFGSLSSMHTHSFCALCNIVVESDLDDFIQINFTVSPQIRRISAHDPEQLTPDDFMFQYHFGREAHFPNGPAFRDVARSIKKSARYLNHDEIWEEDIDVTPGLLNVFNFGQKAALFILIDDSGQKISSLDLTLAGDAFNEVAAHLAPGKIRVKVKNGMAQRALIAFFNLPPEAMDKSVKMEFDPFLTGKRLLSTQTFRDLFRNEIIEGEEGIGVKDLTFLFTDLKGSTALYERIGDLKAFSLVRQHFASLSKVIGQFSGAIVKTIGDAVMATFLTPEDAVKAAEEMLLEIEKFNSAQASKEIILKIGIHKGGSIAVTLNDRLDYFGQTVNIAARVQALADAEEIYITQEIFKAQGIEKLLEGFTVTPEKKQLKGIQDEMQVYKIIHKSRQAA